MKAFEFVKKNYKVQGFVATRNFVGMTNLCNGPCQPDNCCQYDNCCQKGD